MSMAEKLAEIEHLLQKLRAEYPAESGAFLHFMQTAESGKALDLRTMELINVALAISAQCEWCIALHVKQALTAGATRDQVMSAGFMAVLMHGGPALMYLTPLTHALAEFSATA